MKLIDKIAAIGQNEKMIQEELIARIMRIGDNPEATVLSENPQCLSVSFSQLQRNWTPFFHNFDSQKKLLVKIVNHDGHAAASIIRLTGIIESGRAHFEGITRKFNPLVLSQLEELLRE